MRMLRSGMADAPAVPPAAAMQSNPQLIAARGSDPGVVFQGLPTTGDFAPEVSEFATGFIDPSALAVGLDGTVYVADAAANQVIKITPRTIDTR